MKPGELIKILQKLPQDTVFESGFTNPHSYRGSYYELAVEPKDFAKVSDMLKELQDVLNETLEGYKGGGFIMHEKVDVYMAFYGCTGQQTDSLILNLLTDEYKITFKEEW